MNSVTSSSNALISIEQIKPIDFATANSRDIYLAYTMPIEQLYSKYIKEYIMLKGDEIDPSTVRRSTSLFYEGRYYFYQISEFMTAHYSGWEKVNAFVNSIFGGPQLIEQLPEINYKIFSSFDQSNLSKLHEKMTHHVMKCYNLQNEVFFVIKEKYISGHSDNWLVDDEGKITDFLTENIYDNRVILFRSDENGWKLEYYRSDPNLNSSIYFIKTTEGLVCNTNWNWCTSEFYMNDLLNHIQDNVQYHISMTILNNYFPNEISDIILGYAE